MGYRFKHKEPFADGVRRIGKEQLSRIARQLALDTDRALAVHDARKGLKRMRALLRLIRPVVDNRWLREQDAAYREIARGLADMRDVDSALACIAKLEVAAKSLAANAALVRLKAQLQVQRDALQTGAIDATSAKARKALKAAARRFAAVKLDRRGFTIVGRGLALTCEQGRRLQARAYGNGADADFHRWRKRVQHHWRHMQLLARAWPEAMAAREALARELAELLGDEHDLTELACEIKRRASDLGPAGAVLSLQRACAARKAELRRLAEPRGRRLLAEHGKALARRIERYWDHPVG